MKTTVIGGKEFEVVDMARITDENKAVVGYMSVISMTDDAEYQWRLFALQSRLKHPENYADEEDVNKVITGLIQWLSEYHMKEAVVA